MEKLNEANCIDGFTPLHYAVENSYPAAVCLLIKYGANSNIIFYRQPPRSHLRFDQPDCTKENVQSLLFLGAITQEEANAKFIEIEEQKRAEEEQKKAKEEQARLRHMEYVEKRKQQIEKRKQQIEKRKQDNSVM